MRLKVVSNFELTTLSITISDSFPIFSNFSEKSLISDVNIKESSLNSYLGFSFKYLLRIFGMIFFLPQSDFFCDFSSFNSELLNKIFLSCKSSFFFHNYIMNLGKMNY